VTITEHGRKRAIYRTVCSGGSFGANPLRQQIGLGDAKEIEGVEVWWPVTNRRQEFHDVPLDSFLRIVEGARRLEVENIPPTPMPAPAP
jgi:hypothetical protein